jgi:DNA repair photolyase
MIPGLNDHELERILAACSDAGAASAGYVLLRLPGEVKELFHEWLGAHYPARAAHVLNLVRQCHGGALYDPAFGARMRGSGPFAELLRRRFEIACRRLGLDKRASSLDTSRFHVPDPRPGQRPLFT